MVKFGKSRAADSASAIPSITGIWMSVSRRSNMPDSRVRMSSASAPSCAVIVSWPSMAMARATRTRIGSSSSAIKTRGIARTGFARRTAQRGSGAAAGDVPPVEKPYIDIAAFGGRRGEAGLEGGAFARLQHGLLQHGVPGVDFRALSVANAETQPRQFDRAAGLA